MRKRRVMVMISHRDIGPGRDRLRWLGRRLGRGLVFFWVSVTRERRMREGRDERGEGRGERRGEGEGRKKEKKTNGVTSGEQRLLRALSGLCARLGWEGGRGGASV